MSHSRFPPRSGTLGGSSWLDTVAETTLTGLLDTHSMQQHPHDDRTMIRDTMGDNTIFREIEADPELKALIGERTNEPLMQVAAPPIVVKEVAQGAKIHIPISRKEPSLREGNRSKNESTENSTKSSTAPISPSVASSADARKKLSQGPSPLVDKNVKSKLEPNLNSLPLKGAASANTTNPIAQSSSASSVSKKKVTKKNGVDEVRKKATRTAFAAFMHLHQPSMTQAEQTAFVRKYEGRESEMWRILADRFGKDSVPERLLQTTEDARGSIRIQVVPRGIPHGRPMMKAMKECGIEATTKENASRTMTVGDLENVLRFRWEGVNDKLSLLGLSLCLFSQGANTPLSPGHEVRDCVVDGCIEYAWVSTGLGAAQSTIDEDSWGQQHSLAAPPMSPKSAQPSPASLLDSPSKDKTKSSEGRAETSKRRIQPISVSSDVAAKRIKADVPSVASQTR